MDGEHKYIHYWNETNDEKNNANGVNTLDDIIGIYVPLHSYFTSVHMLIRIVAVRRFISSFFFRLRKTHVQ